MYALSPNVDLGTLRETFASNMLCMHKLAMPNAGDMQVDNHYLFEVGGKSKNFTQIADLPNSYIIADGIDVGWGNKIPLWLFGIMY